VANPIYREIIPRELTSGEEDSYGPERSRFLTSEGRLDMEKLLEALSAFYKEHHDMITRRKTYNEAAHHLVFLAWLHGIVNAGGRIRREYALGLGRMDLLIEYGADRFAIELKLISKGAREKGIEQLHGYLTRMDLNQGYLVLFDRSNASAAQIGKREIEQFQGKTIHILYL
jgi:hypothetical protein